MLFSARSLAVCFHLIICGSVVNAQDDSGRFDCHPDPNADKAACLARSCIWSFPAGKIKKGVPYCYYPKKYGYTAMNEKISLNSTTWATELSRIMTPTIYPGVYEKLKFIIQSYDDHLRIKIYPAGVNRYEVPIKLYEDEHETPVQLGNGLYRVELTKAPFGFKVIRTDSKVTIWDSSVAPLLFYDQYIQISTKLPTKYLYGFGEHEHATYLHDMNWHTYGMFSMDQFPTPNANLYGHHPMYLAMEPDAKAHAVLLLNSNAMEVKLQPTPALTFRTIGGILDFCIILGDSPEDAVRKYTRAVGKPFMPPYWSLGYQMSRWGYNSLNRVKEVLKRNKEVDFPQDIQYGDIDYMDRHVDFTINKYKYNGLSKFVDELKKDGMKYIVILDPAISANETQKYPAYEDGVKHDVFIKNEDGSTLFGKVWPYYPNTNISIDYDWDNQTRYYRAYTAFPDWTNPNVVKYWSKLVKEFHQTLKFDGLWIDMNEPANFINGKIGGCSKNKLENPPYRPKLVGDSFSYKTLCMSSSSAKGDKHYNTHSLYGLMQSVASYRAVRALFNKRSLVVTRSSYPTTGKYAGHWLGDNLSAWGQMHTSIIGMLEFGLFGIPYIGADICGFRDNAAKSLCNRWMQLGAFYPFCRNHNSFWATPQDPAYFGKEFAANAAKVMRVRYLLLPYLYTLFYEAHTKGSTVVRALMNEFPTDKQTWNIDHQFLWGPALLINPVLEEGATKITAYFPKGRWYDLLNGSEIYNGPLKKGTNISLDAPTNHIPVFSRGGYIIPTQQPANNTMFSRKNNMGVIVSLGEDGTAHGSLFWDDGEAVDSIPSKSLLVDVTFSKNKLVWKVKQTGYSGAAEVKLGEITVFGICGKSVKGLTINNKESKLHKATMENQVLIITGLEHTITSSAEIKVNIQPDRKIACPYKVPPASSAKRFAVNLLILAFTLLWVALLLLLM